MPDQTLQIRGIAELQRALYEYNKRLGDRVTGMAVRLGANYMLPRIRAAAPVSPKGSLSGKKGGPWIRGKAGRLKAAIRIKASRINRRAKNATVGVFITIDPGKSRADPRGAWYGKFVECGFNHGSKVAIGSQAVSMGLITHAEHRARHAFVNSRRSGSGTARSVMTRYGGKAVAGRHFVVNTFNSTKQRSAAIIIDAAETAMRAMASTLNLQGR